MKQPAAPLEQQQAFGGVIDVLEAIGAAYAIWGELAVVMYGQPRFTLDMESCLYLCGGSHSNQTSRLS